MYIVSLCKHISCHHSFVCTKRLHSWSWPRLGFDLCTSYVAIISFRSWFHHLSLPWYSFCLAIGSKKAYSILNHLFGSRASHEIKNEASLCNLILDSKYRTLFTNVSHLEYDFLISTNLKHGSFFV